MEFFREPKFDWMGKKWIFIGSSLFLALIGIISILVHRGLAYGIDFRGGTMVYVKFAQTPDIDKIRKDLGRFTKDEVAINIVPVPKPELDAQLIAESVAQQLEKRASFRRAMKRAVQSCLRLGAQGIRINVSGRLGGAEIARMEWYREGRVPLHTLRGDVDYGFAEARTTYGVIGVKTWVFKGEILGKQAVHARPGEPAPAEAA